MINLAAGKCVACRVDQPTLTDAEIEDLLLHIDGWQVKEVDGMKRLEKVFKFKNFARASEFTAKIGAIAEGENHHPLIITEWGKVPLYRPTLYHSFGNPGYQYVLRFPQNLMKAIFAKL